MKFSIITVTFNSSKTLQATIDSVTKQNYSDIEYIIIDGYSTDITLEIIKSNSSKISKWISEPDNGLYDAMNKGISMATGDIIGILNSDDIFSSNSVLEEIAAFHLKYNIDASIGNVIQKNTNNDIIRVYRSISWTPEKLKIGFMPPHPSIFIRRDLFQKFGLYNTTFKIAADYELVLRFFLKNNISWRYSGIYTTSMLLGGLSSSGFSSYRLITKEIKIALSMNDVEYSPLKIHLRFVWKLFEYINLLK